MQNRQKRRGIIRLIIGLWIVSTILQCLVLGIISAEKREDRLQQTRLFGESMADSIRLTLDNVTEASQALRYLYLQYGEDCFADLDTIGAEIAADQPLIASMYIAPEGVIRAAWPEEVQSSTIGFAMLEDPDQGPRAQLAKDTGLITVAGPHALLEGGCSFIIRNPVFRNGEFMGFTIIVLDWDRLVERIMTDLSGSVSAYRFAVRKDSPDPTAVTDADGFILRSSEAAISDKVDITFHVPNDTWHLVVEPKEGFTVWREMLPMIIASMLLALLLIVSAVSIYISTMRKRENASQELMNARLKEALQRAERADAAKSGFLSRMSHDIRTPLNGIIGLLEIDEKHPRDYERLAENRRKQKLAAKHLLSLINDILDMSKLEDGRTELAHEAFSLSESCAAISGIISQRAVDAGIRFEVLPGDEGKADPNVYGSPLHLRQIFLNIYSNAVKYNRSGGSISTRFEIVRADSARAVYRWTISDTGIGMSPEFLRHLFEPFTQEHIDARSVMKGTGLGMSIVKGLIDRMNGTIEVQSREHVGTTFVITLPFELSGREVTSGPEPTQSRDIHGLRILLAEDNELNAEIAIALLSDAGAAVTHVENGRLALERFSEAPADTWDVILMDIMMPVMDGLEATKAIRALDRPDAATIPIIAMTANAFVEDIRRCMDAGMNRHLAKPIELDKLLEALSIYRK